MTGRTAVVRRVLANRRLRRVVLAFAGFIAAEYGVWLALLVYAYQRGGTAAAAAVAVAQLIPAAFVAPLAAGLADRRGGPSALRVGYLLQAAALGATAALLIVKAPSLGVYACAVVAAAVGDVHPSRAGSAASHAG